MNLALGVCGRQRGELGSDDCSSIAFSSGVTTLALQYGFVSGVVAFDETRLTFELCLDGADFDLDDTAIGVTFDFLKLGAG